MDPQSSTVHQFHHFLCHFTQNYQKNNLGPPSGPTKDPKYDFFPYLFKMGSSVGPPGGSENFFDNFY